MEPAVMDDRPFFNGGRQKCVGANKRFTVPCSLAKVMAITLCAGLMDGPLYFDPHLCLHPVVVVSIEGSSLYEL